MHGVQAFLNLGLQFGIPAAFGKLAAECGFLFLDFPGNFTSFTAALLAAQQPLSHRPLTVFSCAQLHLFRNVAQLETTFYMRFHDFTLAGEGLKPLIQHGQGLLAVVKRMFILPGAFSDLFLFLIQRIMPELHSPFMLFLNRLLRFDQLLLQIVQLSLAADEGITDMLVIFVQHHGVVFLPGSGCHDRIGGIAWLRHIAPVCLNLLHSSFQLGQLFSR
ncbi:hypothetical protein D3C75_823150 [compost metagenome]